MKRFPIFALLIACFACSSDEPGKFISKDLTGIWVNYEQENINGDVRTVSPGESVFGVYAESIQIKHNGIYVPVIWQAADDYFVKKEDKGKLEQSGNKLTLTEGSWRMELTIVKQEGNELWLESTADVFMPAPKGTVIRLSRKSSSTVY